MGNIYIDTSKLKNLYDGTSKVKKIYRDTTMIWQSAIPVAKPTQLTVTKTYNGSAQGNGYTKPDGVILSGNASGTNAGTYTATYTPDADHIWADTEDRTPVTVTMTIGRASVGSKPTTAVSKDYNGSAQTNGYTKPSGVTMTGNASGTNGGTYSATYTPDSNHKWSDGTTGAVTVVLTISYVWIKWNVAVSFTDAAETFSIPANTIRKVLKEGSYTQIKRNVYTYSFNSANGLYNPLDGSLYQIGSNYTTVVDYGAMTTRFGAVGDSSGWKHMASVNQVSDDLNIVASKTQIASSNISTSAKTVELRSAVENRYKGSTNYGAVRSTNLSAYPQNAEQNGYWYVKNW